jgi:hypothetical protein
MVVCLAASREPLRAQATRYMVGGVAGQSLDGNLAGLDEDDVPSAIHLLEGIVITVPPFLHLSRVPKRSEYLVGACKRRQMCSESIAPGV